MRIKGMIMSSPVCCASPGFFDVNSEYFLEKNGGKGEKNERKCENEGNREESGESSSSSDLFESEVTEHSSSSSEDSSSIAARIRPFQKNEVSRLGKRNLEKKSSLTEMEMMKKKFAKLLLGEDMSGCGNGVSTALSISNAITNLCATLFGQIWRLEPLPAHKKLKWRREMEWLLSVSDHIVELTPCFQTFPDGTKLEVMKPRPRSDLYVNLPALRKLDNMLLDILDSFEETEFWYVDQGIIAQEEDGSSSFRKPQHPPRQEEKWWLPVPRVSTSGLTENARKQLKHRRDCTNQILKAAMAINSITLTDMEVPESYLETLPKNARANLGDLIYRYIISDEFSPECLLDCLDLSSEHQALEIANRVEASIYFWRRRASKAYNGTSNSKSSWEMVKDLVIDDAEKEELFADRAESLLLFLKRQFPGLSQTTLDMTKIQYNTDIGKSILESYSRVLESLAFNIVARIDDLLYVDELTRHSDRSVNIITKVGSNVVVADDTDTVVPVVVSSTPHNTAFTTPNISPLKRTTPAANKVVERSATPAENKLRHRGLGVRKVLTDFLNIDTNGSELDSSFKNET